MLGQLHRLMPTTHAERHALGELCADVERMVARIDSPLAAFLDEQRGRFVFADEAARRHGGEAYMRLDEFRELYRRTAATTASTSRARAFEAAYDEPFRQRAPPRRDGDARRPRARRRGDVRLARRRRAEGRRQRPMVPPRNSVLLDLVSLRSLRQYCGVSLTHSVAGSPASSSADPRRPRARACQADVLARDDKPLGQQDFGGFDDAAAISCAARSGAERCDELSSPACRSW